MKNALMQGPFTLKCLDQRFVDVLSLTKKKILIGSHDSCDFKLSDKSISSYHAFILLKGEEGFMVKDLYSEGGVFVNGRRVEESFVGPGDVLTLGTLSFSVETIAGEIEIQNADQDKMTVINTESLFVLPPREGLVFIDGEYCDITFNEEAFKPLNVMPEVSFKGDYVEINEMQDALELSHAVKDKRLEILSFMNGLMMDISYLPLKDGDYYIGSQVKSKKDILFHTVERSKLFSIQEGQLKFTVNAHVSPSSDWDQLKLNDAVFFTHGQEQISLRLVDQSFSWKGMPLFYRDRAFFKQGSKVFAGMFVPMLLLLFISLPVKEEIPDEVAVIYKLPTPTQKPTESQEKSEVKAEELTSKTENTGHKQSDRPADKVEFAQASQNKKVEAKATAPAAASAQPVKTAPVKAYEFKSSVALNALVGDAPKVNTEGSTSKSALKDTNFNAGSSDDGQLVAGANVGVSKFNGSDSKGSGSNSYGSRGLASKAGYDSSYLEPKTVVLGSMDPELLRKILREYIPQFRHCYQQELVGQSDKVQGVIDLNFTIGSAGKVSKYNIKLKDAQFSNKGIGCMGQVLGLIDFPKPKGGGVVDVRQPLNFFAETEKI